MKPKLNKRKENHWILNYHEAVKKNEGKYWTALNKTEHYPKAAEKIFKDLIDLCDGYHINAILSLGYLYLDLGRKEEGVELIKKAYSISLEAIPDDFDEEKGKISWEKLKNRPLLNSFHSMGSELMKEGKYDEAVEKFHFLLKVNPYGNYGSEILLQQCYFHLKQPEKVLELHKFSNESLSIDFAYGAVLANFQLGKNKVAEIAFENAVYEYPKGAREIVKKRHPVPKNEVVGGKGFVEGSNYEAYDYWKNNGTFWKETKGAIDMVKRYKK